MNFLTKLKFNNQEMKLDKESEYIYGVNRGKMMLNFVEEKIGSLQKLIVLDVGCGFGGIALKFSDSCRIVVAIEIDMNRIKLANARIKDVKKSNIYLIRANAAILPFKSEIFNFVIMNGVLEWIAKTPYLHNENPQNVQRIALKEVYRVLNNENGKLYLAIENRLFLGYWLGMKDPHSNLPFTTLLPRPISDLYSKIVKNEDYRTYIYSYLGLRKLLKSCGFDYLDFFVGIKSYQFPFEIKHINDRKGLLDAFEKYMESKSYKIVAKIMVHLGLIKLLSHNFIVICSKTSNKKLASNTPCASKDFSSKDKLLQMKNEFQENI